jgi:predicted DNA-binding protein
MSKHVTIRLDEEFLQRLKVRAAERGTTVTALITEAAKRELDENRDRFLAAAAEFNTDENWAYVQDRFGPRK